MIPCEWVGTARVMGAAGASLVTLWRSVVQSCVVPVHGAHCPSRAAKVTLDMTSSLAMLELVLACFAILYRSHGFM
jgi:hypothetical protein